MAKKSFKSQKSTQKSVSLTIVEGEKTIIGHIRIKPNNVLWCPAGGHNWYGVTLGEFSKYVETHGNKQKK